jgi:hypothetical protein
MVSGRWSDSPSASWSRSEFKPGFLPARRAVFLSWFLCLSGVLCTSKALSPTRWENEFPLWFKLSIGTWWDLLPVVWGMYPGDKGGDNSPSALMPESPQVLLWEIMSWDMSPWGRLSGSNVYFASTDPADSCPKAEPENKGVSPYVLLQAGYRSKKQSTTHIWLPVTSLAI